MVRTNAVYQVDYFRRHDDCQRIMPLESIKLLAETPQHALQQAERRAGCAIDVFDVRTSTQADYDNYILASERKLMGGA